MKKVFSMLLVALYRIDNRILRRLLRGMMGRLDGGQAFSQSIREAMKRYHGIEIGIGTYGPCFNEVQTWTGEGNLTVGKYCSLAAGVCIYSRNHPYWFASTSPLFYNPNFANNINEDAVRYGKLAIGNDVWIGQYAIILPSCKSIGNGAVIGADAIVTKDVPPYAVVAGNPAKVLKYRFDEATVRKLEEICWWDWCLDEIKAHADIFQNVESLIHYAEEREGLKG